MTDEILKIFLGNQEKTRGFYAQFGFTELEYYLRDLAGRENPALGTRVIESISRSKFGRDGETTSELASASNREIYRAVGQFGSKGMELLNMALVVMRSVTLQNNS